MKKINKTSFLFFIRLQFGRSHFVPFAISRQGTAKKIKKLSISAKLHQTVQTNPIKAQPLFIKTLEILINKLM